MMKTIFHAETQNSVDGNGVVLSFTTSFKSGLIMRRHIT